jgi:sugar phosphate isomerase/epimerase
MDYTSLEFGELYMKNIEKISRRELLKTTIGFGFGCFISQGIFSTLRGHPNENSFLSEIGVCTSIENNHLLKKNGCTFVEERVSSFLVPTENESYFAKSLALLAKSELPVFSCKNFLPGNLPCVGENLDRGAVLEYAEVVFKRAKQSSVKTIVFGSGNSRKIPENFDRDIAKSQFIDLLKEMSPVAAKYGIIISLEPLNRAETNFINSLSEGVEIIEAVDHPNLKLLVDIYHMMREGEPPTEIEKADRHIYHCHIAEKDQRIAPVTMKDDFRPYFKALKKVNYTGKLSMETGWGDMEKELPLAMRVLRKQISEI